MSRAPKLTHHHWYMLCFAHPTRGVVNRPVLQVSCKSPRTGYDHARAQWR